MCVRRRQSPRPLNGPLDRRPTIRWFLKGKEKRRESRFRGEYFSLNKATNLTFGFELTKGEFADSFVLQIFYSGSPNIIQYMAGDVEWLTDNKSTELLPYLIVIFVI